MTDMQLTIDLAMSHVSAVSLRTGPVERLGVELEWLVRDAADPAAPVPLDRVRQTVRDCGELPGGGQLTCEPGGQVELSSAAGLGLAGCVADTVADLRILREAAHANNLELLGYGLDPVRPPRRIVDAPRYRAMAEYFAPFSPAGQLMMCSTASVQVCVDAGPGSGGDRWRLAHALGPVLVAAFANSPLREGRPTGWKSTRWAVWDALDPARTRPVTLRAGEDLRSAYARYVLDAPVMCVRDGSGVWRVPQGLTFRQWIQSPGTRAPGLDDLDYHLSTLFPPVRARGYLELRMIDAQREDGWLVPLGVVSALMDDPVAAAAAMAATEEVRGAWQSAARHGLSTPAMARAARQCFAAAADALERTNAPAEVRAAVADFRETYVERGRCPADACL
ncbi:ergothioneine biosynthesis glutamate--cysteine ligase EgtA [Longispora sp. NPDC051575]|uniref:ergothioneine biosynthesis glutamate--cysteine ligase EgtA n=1 Tax=Longispora sp. NPDC051575 TaxID=3154943 RepID=UPI00341EA4ED